VQHKQDIGTRPLLSGYYRPAFKNQLAARDELKGDYSASGGQPKPPAEKQG
jgi:hypothetical protein